MHTSLLVRKIIGFFGFSIICFKWQKAFITCLKCMWSEGQERHCTSVRYKDNKVCPVPPPARAYLCNTRVYAVLSNADQDGQMFWKNGYGFTWSDTLPKVQSIVDYGDSSPPTKETQGTEAANETTCLSIFSCRRTDALRIETEKDDGITVHLNVRVCTFFEQHTPVPVPQRLDVRAVLIL